MQIMDGWVFYLKHISHLCDLTPRCESMCSFKWPFRLNELGHTEHTNFRSWSDVHFSSVNSICPSLVNIIGSFIIISNWMSSSSSSSSSHSCWFAFFFFLTGDRWHFKWRFSSPFVTHNCEQMKHWNIGLSRCVSRQCSSKVSELWNVCKQMPQAYCCENFEWVLKCLLRELFTENCLPQFVIGQQNGCEKSFFLSCHDTIQWILLSHLFFCMNAYVTN